MTELLRVANTPETHPSSATPAEPHPPVMVFEAGKEVLITARARALARELPVAVFTADLFSTGNDRDNRAAVRAVPGSDLDLVGLGVHGGRAVVDRVVKGARLHP